LCNDLYTAYFTEKNKNRLTILDILRGYGERRYLFNEETFILLERLRRILIGMETNRQGEPGFHLNGQVTSDDPGQENGQNGKHPQSTLEAPGSESTPTPTPNHGRRPGSGGDNQGGNK